MNPGKVTITRVTKICIGILNISMNLRFTSTKNCRTRLGLYTALLTASISVSSLESSSELVWNSFSPNLTNASSKEFERNPKETPFISSCSTNEVVLSRSVIGTVRSTVSDKAILLKSMTGSLKNSFDVLWMKSRSSFVTLVKVNS